MAKKAQGAFRTISEVADWLDVPAHVLRFWESKFNQIKPVKRAGGRRYYRPEDMLLIGGIKKLLHDDGLTIRGVQKMISQDGIKSISEQSQELDMPSDAEAAERRKARRAKRKAKSEASRSAKPPLDRAPEVSSSPETPSVEQQDAAPSDPASPDAESPDNIVPFQGRDAEDSESAVSESSEPESSEADTASADHISTEAVSSEHTHADASDDAGFDESILSEDTVEFEEAEAQAAADADHMGTDESRSASEDDNESWDAPSEDDGDAAELAPIEAKGDAVDSDPAPEDVKVSARIAKSETAMKSLRRHKPGTVARTDTLTTLYDRLRDLRNRMDDDSPSA